MASNNEDAKLPSSSEPTKGCEESVGEPSSQNTTPSGDKSADMTPPPDKTTPLEGGAAPPSSSSSSGTGTKMSMSSRQKIIQTLASDGHVRLLGTSDREKKMLGN